MLPRVVPRKEHGISRKQVSPNALRTLYRLRDHGFMACLVGGCVRDLLLGRSPKDFDIATDATPNEIKRLFRNCRLVGRRFRLAHLHFQDEIIEVSTFRAAVPENSDPHEETGDEGTDGRRLVERHLKSEDGMVLRDNVFGTPEEDALRRDFTINALFYNISDFSVMDYTTGLSDLEQRILRPIGDPAVRFTEDPVRMVRAVRFAASHGFTIEPSAWEALCTLAPSITRASPARLYEEVLKLFLKGSARQVFPLLEASGLFAALFPFFQIWIEGNGRGRWILETNLTGMDDLHRQGEPLSPGFFLASFLGPLLEEKALACHREGTPHQQALHTECTSALQEICRTVTIPGRVGSQMRSVLALQPSLHRRPPRRPAALVKRPDFGHALAYLRLVAQTREGYDKTLQWWDAYLSGTPLVEDSMEKGKDNGSGKRRRKRRRRKKT